MTQTLGESREAWGEAVCKMAEDFVNNTKSDVKPFYIVFAAKPDKNKPSVMRQTMKAYRQRPPAILGILVWYVDNAQGIFEFMPELSSPPDIPIDESLLSTKSSDSFERVAQQGKKMNVILS